MSNPRVLLITSNGWGMGHLVRQLTIAAALPAQTPYAILTLSGAAAVAANPHLEYAPSYSQPWISRGSWHGGYLRDRILALSAEFKPTVIVFDGVVPYPGLLDAIRELSVVKVWMRRGLWRDNTNPKPLRDSDWFDLILEPADLGDSRDSGPTAHRTDAIKIGVITDADPTHALDRKSAAAKLGIDPDRPTLLMNLGSSAIGDLTPVAEVLASFPDWQVLTTKDELGRTKSLSGTSQVRQLQNIFPLHPYLNAVDLAVTSVGYNAAHEFVGMHVPGLYVPAPNVTDDQSARAAAIADLGAGWNVATPSAVAVAAVLSDILSNPVALATARAACAEVSAQWEPGAQAAVQQILAAHRNAKPSAFSHLRLWLKVNFELRFGNLLRRTPQPRFEHIEISSKLSSAQISSGLPFEHILTNSSGEYLERRKALTLKWLGTSSAKN